MSIEFIFNSVTIQSDQIQEEFPFLVDGISEYLPVHKTPKKRKRRKKKTAGSLIEEIIADVEK